MFFFRADANENIGTGHVMRCLSIAKAFAEHGENVKFITADHKGDRLIQQAGFNSFCLDSDWTQMENELPKLKRRIDKDNPTLLLVDSYYVTKRYFRELHKSVRTAYMDDLNIDCWDIDFLVNYNIFGTSFDYSIYKETRTELLLGPKYAPLRSEFHSLPSHVIQRSVTDILISAGGSDPERITEKMMIYICPKWPEVQFHFIVGALNPRAEGIKALAAKTTNAILHINERHMSELMGKCDMAISAAGSTLYELCAAGVPTITYSLADNQIVATEQFEKLGIMLNAGDCRENTCFIECVDEFINRVANNKALRENLSLKMQRLVDGKGADRIALSLMEEMASNYFEK